MKKIFLTSGLVICMACPAFATKDLDTSGHASGVTQGEECVNEVLGVYSAPEGNPVQLEAKWNANVYTVNVNDSRYATSSSTDAQYTATTSAATTPMYVKYEEGIYASTAYAEAETPKLNGLTTLPTMTGYDFAGLYTGKAGTGYQVTNANGTWYTSDSAHLPNTLVNTTSTSTPTTWYAHWTPQTFSVVYAPGDHAASGSDNYTDPTAATYDASYSVLKLAQTSNISAATGYTFAGWKDLTHNITYSADATTGDITPATVNNGVWKYTDGITLTAQYTANQYTVTYAEGTHGTGAGSTDTLTYDTAYNIKTLANAGVAAAAGYHFTEWSGSNSQKYANEGTIAASTVSSNLTLTAQYAANVTNVTYSCGSQTGVTGTAPSFGNDANNHTNTATYGASYTFAANSGNCAVPGYTFQGWSCTGLGDTTQTAGGEISWSYTGTHNGNITCTAVFGANTIHVNWYKNDGSDESETQYHNNSCIYDSTLQVPANPTRDGYQFSGWTVRTNE